MKVSILCLTYNHEKYIGKALDGILSQKVDFDYEILVGDDASSDDTVKIVKEYTTKYPDKIKLFCNDENIGATRNAFNLLTIAEGDYIATCEGDDYWSSVDKLQTQVDFLDNNSRYVGCVHNVKLIDELGKPIKRQKLAWLSNKRVFTLQDFDGMHIPGHVCSVLRRNIIKTSDVDINILWQASEYVGDRTTFLIWLRYGDFYKFDEPMTDYRIRRGDDNVTSMVYAKNTNRTRAEFNYICNLADYASKVAPSVNFEKSFENLYVSAIFDLLRYGKQSDGILPKEIKRRIKNKCSLYFRFIFIVIKKAVLKYTTVS